MSQEKPSYPLGLVIIISVGAVQIFGMLSGLLGTKGISGWYSELARPAATPPAMVFGLVWPLLYALIGASLALIIVRGGGRRKVLLRAFALQLLLNLAWTPVFFGLHQIGAALFVIVALFVSILVLIGLLWKPVPLAARLLIPYLLWVGFATYLNAGYWLLNS